MAVRGWWWRATLSCLSILPCVRIVLSTATSLDVAGLLVWFLCLVAYVLQIALFRLALRHTVRGRFAFAFAKLCLILRTVLRSLRKIQCFAIERAVCPRFARQPAALYTIKIPPVAFYTPHRGRLNPPPCGFRHAPLGGVQTLRRNIIFPHR